MEYTLTQNETTKKSAKLENNSEKLHKLITELKKHHITNIDNLDDYMLKKLLAIVYTRVNKVNIMPLKKFLNDHKFYINNLLLYFKDRPLVDASQMPHATSAKNIAIALIVMREIRECPEYVHFRPTEQIAQENIYLPRYIIQEILAKFGMTKKASTSIAKIQYCEAGRHRFKQAWNMLATNDERAILATLALDLTIDGRFKPKSSSSPSEKEKNIEETEYTSDIFSNNIDTFEWFPIDVNIEDITISEYFAHIFE